MTWTNAQLRRRLRDALADQRGSLYKKLAAGTPVTSAYEKTLLRTALGDQSKGLLGKLEESVGTVDAVEVQHIAFGNTPNFGTYKLAYNGNETASINYNDNAATVQTRLRALTGLSAVTVTGSVGAGFNVTFTGVLGDVEKLQRTTSTLQVNAVAATATLDLTADIALTSATTGAARNTTTFTLQILPAAANPTNTVLAAFTGTAAAIVLTITPNNGTNNSATVVNLTTAQVRELITTGAVAGKSVTVTDLSTLRALQTATGGGATNVADGGEGDGVVATYAAGADAALTSTTVTETTKGKAAVLERDEKNRLTDGLSDRALATVLAAGTDFSA